MHNLKRISKTIKYNFSSQDRIKTNNSRQKNIKIQDLLIKSQQIPSIPQNLQKILFIYKKIIELKSQIELNKDLVFSDFWLEFNKMIKKITILIIQTKNYQEFIKLNWQLIEKQRSYSIQYLDFVSDLIRIYDSMAKLYYFNSNYQQSKKMTNYAINTYNSITIILQQKRMISTLNSQLIFLIQLTKFFQAIDNPHKTQNAITHMLYNFKLIINQKQFLSNEIYPMIELIHNKINVLFRTLLTCQNHHEYQNQIIQIIGKIQQLIPGQKSSCTFQLLAQIGDFYLLFKNITRYTNIVNKINQLNCQNDLQQVIVYRMNSKFINNFEPIQQYLHIAQKYIIKALNMNENSHFNNDEYQLYVRNSLLMSSSSSLSVPAKQKQKYLLKAYDFIKRPTYKYKQLNQNQQQLYYLNKSKIQLQLANLYSCFPNQFTITSQQIYNLLSSAKLQLQKLNKQQAEQYEFIKIRLNFNNLVFLMNIIPIKTQNHQQILLNTRQYFKGCRLYPDFYKPSQIMEIFSAIKPQNHSSEVVEITDQIEKIYAKQFPKEFEEVVLKPFNQQSQDKYFVNSQVKL